METRTSQMICGSCGLYDYTYAEGATPEETFGNLTGAQDAASAKHSQWHADNDIVHIRTQINPRRVRTGNQYYKNRVQLSAAESGRLALCGGKVTSSDMSYGETRHASQLACVTCPDCKRIRQGQ